MFLNHNHIAYKGYIYYLKRWKDGRKEQKEELIRMLTPDPMVGRTQMEEAVDKISSSQSP